MSHRPPFARMRDIKRQSIARRAEAEEIDASATAEAEPASVDEALGAEPVAEPEPEAVAEAEPEAAEPDPEPEAAEPDPEPEAAGDPEINMDMKRSELNAIAESLGVESPEKLSNKKAVIDAIHEAQGEG